MVLRKRNRPEEEMELPPISISKLPEGLEPIGETPLREIVIPKTRKLPAPIKLEVEKRGPIFISLDRYNDIKDNLALLRRASSMLKDVLEDLKDNKGQGANLLEESTENLEEIEEKISNISKTLQM